MRAAELNRLQQQQDVSALASVQTVIDFLSEQVADLDRQIEESIEADPQSAARDKALRQCPASARWSVARCWRSCRNWDQSAAAGSRHWPDWLPLLTTRAPSRASDPSRGEGSPCVACCIWRPSPPAGSTPSSDRSTTAQESRQVVQASHRGLHAKAADPPE